MISDSIRNRLYDAGLDCVEMVSRFMDSEEMFLKYFLRFFDDADSVVNQLSEAIERGDCKEIERTAHALKGLSGNIGMNGVYLPSKKIVDDVRAGKTDGFQKDFDKLYAAYSAALSARKMLG